MNSKLKLIEDFILFAKSNLDLSLLDAVYVKNRLYDELNISPGDEVIKPSIHDVNYFVSNFSSLLKNEGLNDTDINIKISKLFDLVSSRPSEVVNKFNLLLKKDPKLATSYLYNLGINNYYIHKKDIDKNIQWNARFKDGPDIEISINLSKPEKNNKDIQKLLTAKSSNYPKCVLCLENLGFKGDSKKAPRHNIRIISLKLNNEDWFMQYSPYGYFKEHMILVDCKHENMEISPRIFKVLFAFLNKFPHYSITSNSDLPIVGGSILNHEHFQGGNYVFPIQKAKDKFIIKSNKFKNTKISYLDFYNSAFKLKGKDEKEIISLASLILSKWRKYSDKNVDIIASSNGNIHNTITPILRKNNKDYEFILILRNNNTSEEYPDGIYHVHPEYFAIKKEGIGVIEASGRFILPARLVRQINEVNDVVKHKYNEKVYLKKYPDLEEFTNMIETMKNKKITAKEYINETGRNILLNTSVFKKDKNGFDALNRFIKSLSL